jgi:hypothetical protein
MPTAQLQAHLNVLSNRQSWSEIVLLKDEADLPTQLDPDFLPGSDQFRVEDAHAAVHGGTKTADNGQQSALARSRRSGEHDNLTRVQLQGQVHEHGVYLPALSMRIAEASHIDQRLFHQNTSAGSRPFSLRIASNPDNAHITTVTPSTIAPRSSVMTRGN